jgi:polyhydroxyalkanoate synthesis regulator phasin
MEASENTIGPVSEEEARRAVDELVQIRRVANQDLPPKNLDVLRVRDKLEAIDLYAEKAIAILKGIA